MKVVLQRTTKASVKVNNEVIGKIDNGLVVLVSFTHDDNLIIIDKMVDKIINLRIFDDENNIMNKSLIDTKGSILSISQFTLYANTKKGRRPSYADALGASKAIEFYEYFNNKIKSSNINIETGKFQEDMKVELINDGPITIIIDSKEV